ncbi:MAG: flagellar brake protein, partial [Anaerolineae bacterium]|nr:flagellar brake protein [Anaerolineae bacterium]
MTVVDGKEPDIASHLSVGLAVMVHVAPNRNDSPRFKTYLRGWQHGSYIILDVPAEFGESLPVRPQQSVVMRFMSQGAACGCLTTILDMGSGKQMQYIRVAWPEDVRVIALRRQER